MDPETLIKLAGQFPVLAIAVLAMYWQRAEAAGRLEDAKARVDEMARVAQVEREDKLRLAEVLDKNTAAIVQLIELVRGDRRQNMRRGGSDVTGSPSKN